MEKIKIELNEREYKNVNFGKTQIQVKRRLTTEEQLVIILETIKVALKKDEQGHSIDFGEVYRYNKVTAEHTFNILVFKFVTNVDLAEYLSRESCDIDLLYENGLEDIIWQNVENYDTTYNYYVDIITEITKPESILGGALEDIRDYVLPKFIDADADKMLEVVKEVSRILKLDAFKKNES